MRSSDGQEAPTSARGAGRGYPLRKADVPQNNGPQKNPGGLRSPDAPAKKLGGLRFRLSVQSDASSKGPSKDDIEMPNADGMLASTSEVVTYSDVENASEEGSDRSEIVDLADPSMLSDRHSHIMAELRKTPVKQMADAFPLPPDLQPEAEESISCVEEDEEKVQEDRIDKLLEKLNDLVQTAASATYPRERRRLEDNKEDEYSFDEDFQKPNDSVVVEEMLQKMAQNLAAPEESSELAEDPASSPSSRNASMELSSANQKLHEQEAEIAKWSQMHEDKAREVQALTEALQARDKELQDLRSLAESLARATNFAEEQEAAANASAYHAAAQAHAAVKAAAAAKKATSAPTAGKSPPVNVTATPANSNAGSGTAVCEPAADILSASRRHRRQDSVGLMESTEVAQLEGLLQDNRKELSRLHQAIHGLNNQDLWKAPDLPTNAVQMHAAVSKEVEIPLEPLMFAESMTSGGTQDLPIPKVTQAGHRAQSPNGRALSPNGVNFPCGCRSAPVSPPTMCRSWSPVPMRTSIGSAASYNLKPHTPRCSFGSARTDCSRSSATTIKVLRQISAPGAQAIYVPTSITAPNGGNPRPFTPISPRQKPIAPAPGSHVAPAGPIGHGSHVAPAGHIAPGYAPRVIFSTPAVAQGVIAQAPHMAPGCAPGCPSPHLGWRPGFPAVDVNESIAMVPGALRSGTPVMERAEPNGAPCPGVPRIGLAPLEPLAMVPRG